MKGSYDSLDTKVILESYERQGKNNTEVHCKNMM